MHEARQTFCLDLFSMFHKNRSCSTLYFLSRYANNNDRIFKLIVAKSSKLQMLFTIKKI